MTSFQTLSEFVDNQEFHHNQPRSQVMDLCVSVGHLCSLFLSHAPMDDPFIVTAVANDAANIDNDDDAGNHHSRSNHDTTYTPPSSKNSNIMAQHPFWSTPSPCREDIHRTLGKIFWNVLVVSKSTNINLWTSILKKMDLNARKYPVHLCKGKSGKYTKYSSHTGITENNQSLLDISLESEMSHATEDATNNQQHDQDWNQGASYPPTTVPQLMQLIRNFALERHWSIYHTPRNLVLAMMGEMGELAEIFQWLGDLPNKEPQHQDFGLHSRGWKEEDTDHLEQELADVSIYCLRLADVLGIQDLGYVVLNSC